MAKKDEGMSATPSPAAVVTEQTETIVPSSRLRDYMKNKFPDREYADDTEFDSAVADYLTETDDRLNEYASSDETIRRVAKDYPEIMAIVKDISDGKTIEEALAMNVDIEDLIPGESEPDYTKYAAARDKRRAMRAEQEKYQQALDHNLEESKQIIQDYFSQRNMDEVQAKAFAESIDKVVDDYLNGKITTELLDLFYNGQHYTNDIEAAREAGEVTGRNAQIDAVREQRMSETDGLPSAGSAAGVAEQQMPSAQKNFIDEVVESTKQRRDWL